MSVTNSGNSALRRHYPKEPDGAKNQWSALLNHYSEAEDAAVAYEREYVKKKVEKQKETYESQLAEKNKLNNLEKQKEIEIEKDILNKDLFALNQQIATDKWRKNMIDSEFVKGNESLLLSKQEQALQNRLESAHIDRQLIQSDLTSEDKNLIRANNSSNLSKIAMDYNRSMMNQLRGSASEYIYPGKIIDKGLDRDVHYKQGDIFDSMFARPKHWKNFYGIVDHHQIGNIVSHANQFSEKESERQGRINQFIEKNVVSKSLQNEELYNARTRQRNEMKNNYKNDLVSAYNSQEIEATMGKEYLAKWRSDMARVRKSQIRQQELEDEELLRLKLQQEENYRMALSKQQKILEIKNINRERMTQEEKKLNYEDLQEWKSLGKDFYTRSIPGIRTTVNPLMAKRVLGLFGKDSTQQPPQRFLNQNLPHYERKYPKK